MAKYHPEELMQLGLLCERLGAVAPGQQRNASLVLRRARMGGDIKIPLNIVMDEVLLQMHQSGENEKLLTDDEKTTAGIFLRLSTELSPRYDEKRDGPRDYVKRPVRTPLMGRGREAYTPIAITDVIMVQLANAYAARAAIGFSEAVESIANDVGASERTMWRYVGEGVPERMNRRVRTELEKLIRGFRLVQNEPTEIIESQSE